MNYSISATSTSEGVKVDTACTSDKRKIDNIQGWLASDQPEAHKDQKDKIAELASGFTEVWTMMGTLGVVSVAVLFSGGCDSGQIDDVDLICFDGSAQDDFQKALQKHREAIAALPRESSDCMENLVKRLSDAILDDESIPNWYNDDGGHGSLIWTLATKSIKIEVNQRVVETTNLIYDAYGVEVQ